MKLVRIPALFGATAVAGFAWVQYQANRTSRPMDYAVVDR
jgi:hypothetical protein